MVDNLSTERKNILVNTDNNENFGENIQENKVNSIYIFYPKEKIFTALTNYTKDEIFEIIKTLRAKRKYFILQINNDTKMVDYIINLVYSSSIENTEKMFDLNIDYVFCSKDKTLSINLSIFKEIKDFNIEKFIIKLFFCDYATFITNKNGCSNIVNLFIQKLKFKEIDSISFFTSLYSQKQKTQGVYDKNYEIQLVLDLGYLNNLLYILFEFSISALQNFVNKFYAEVDSMTLENLQKNSRIMDIITQKLHLFESSIILFKQEIKIKNNFLKKFHSTFEVFHKICNIQLDFEQNNLILELMLSRIMEFQSCFENFESIINVRKKTYINIMHNHSNAENEKSSKIVTILTVLSLIVMPKNAVVGLFSMNIMTPFFKKDCPYLVPFFGILTFLVILILIQLCVFRRYKVI
jgi:hypothetical protein